MSALTDWNDPLGCRDVSSAEEIIWELEAACQAMIDCTGGSKNWNGETQKALEMIEAALGISQ